MAASLVAAERGGVPCAPSRQRRAGDAGEIPGCSSLGGERFVRSALAVGRAGWRCPKVAVLRALAVSPQALPAAACPGKPCEWSGASRGCPGDATPPTPFWAFPCLRGSLSHPTSQDAGVPGEGNSALTQLSSPLSPRGTRAGSPTACFSGELYLPDREASCRLPGGMKALLPLQPVSGCVPSARRREQPRLTRGAPTQIPGTPTAKAAELQVTIQNPGQSGFSLG